MPKRITSQTKLLIGLLLSIILFTACSGGRPEFKKVDSPQEYGEYRNPKFPPGYQKPLSYLPVPQHPFLAPNGKSNMHNDAYMSDIYEVSGPLGINTEVSLNSYDLFVNLCVTLTFDSKGRIITSVSKAGKMSISLIDRQTMKEIANYELPQRGPEWKKDPLFPNGDTSGGAYFVLDHLDRVIVATAAGTLEFVKFNDAKGEFEKLLEYDLKPHLVQMTPPYKDRVQMAIPDWKGEFYWFTTRYGNVGTINRDGGVKTIELKGEQMQNSFTVGEDGIYVVTDYAMYRFNAEADGTPKADWRTPYDRGTHQKPGLLSQGSGTSPQLFVGDMIAISDNAEPKSNVLFLKRDSGEITGKIAIFKDNFSATENALPGFTRKGPNGLEYSLIVENNWGKSSDSIRTERDICKQTVGGITRIDLIPDAKGNYQTKEIWTSQENSCSTVPKVSAANGLLYLHTYHRLPEGKHGWALTAVDYASGETVYRVPTGIGMQYIDFGAPIILDPDGGQIYLGTFFGLLSIKDKP